VSVDRLATAQASTTAATQVGNDRSSLERLKADELAHEFESMLILQMLRQMRQSMTEGMDEEEKGLSADTMVDMVDGELARQLSRQGGLGLADMMKQAIIQQLPSGQSTSVSGGTAGLDLTAFPATSGITSSGPTALTASLSGIPATAVAAGIDDTKVTSAFGWRSDPFSGQTKYHGGIDLRAAYGQGVPAAGDGRVLEVEEKGAYGLTVLLEHSDGVRTRYAHLSAADVSVGDRVLQGQEIGRVGQSGRATGPHLHFEVIRDGRRIDPSEVAALQGSGLGGLKLAGALADSSIGGHLHSPAMSGVDDED
jgi:murein DD-endopeptidase MepM/ murein hydrolase activator NlpD